MHSSSPFTLYTCLPFVELAHEASVQIGPVLFWPSSKYKEFIPPEDQEMFQHYITSVGQIRLENKANQSQISTRTLSPQTITCLSICPNVPVHQREFMLIDALYLLYFACTFRNLYYTTEIPSFHAFRKMIPASLDFIREKQNWEHQCIQEIQREETVCLHFFDLEICDGLGKALTGVYEDSSTIDQGKLHSYKRLIRSIRYLVDRFFQRFVNLFDKGLDFSTELFDPEDVIFLASGFEALFAISSQHVTADFKHKLRPLLHLKYSRPLEIFWKWADDFYEAKWKIIQGGDYLDHLFTHNPNFKVSHIIIGIKLFIYSIYYKLFKYGLIHSQKEEHYNPPDFRWIHPEEVLLFFWTETNLLRKLSLFLTGLKQNRSDPELKEEVYFVANLFVFMYEHYFLLEKKEASSKKGLLFIPTPSQELQPYYDSIIEILEEQNKKGEEMYSLLPKKFLKCLKARLAAST